jgi:hypothetical protein
MILSAQSPEDFQTARMLVHDDLECVQLMLVTGHLLVTQSPNLSADPTPIIDLLFEWQDVVIPAENFDDAMAANLETIYTGGGDANSTDLLSCLAAIASVDSSWRVSLDEAEALIGSLRTAAVS